MLKQPILDQLHALRLPMMADTYHRLAQDPEVNGLTFDERFALLVDAEWISRQNRKLAKLLRDAHLRLPACPEDVDVQPPARTGSRLTAHVVGKSVGGAPSPRGRDWSYGRRQNLFCVRSRARRLSSGLPRPIPASAPTAG